MKKETRNILIGAGVLALLYFLFKKQKNGVTTKTTGDSKASDLSVDVKEGGKSEVNLDEMNTMKSSFVNANGTYTYQITSSPNQGGSASLQGSVLTYQPQTDFVGTETLTYKILDSDGASSNEATITFNVTPVYDGSPAKNITQTVSEDGSVTFDIATASDSGTSAPTPSGRGSGGSQSSTSTATENPAQQLVSQSRG